MIIPQLQRILKQLDPTPDLEVHPPVFGWKDGKHQLITPAVKIKVDDLSEEVKQFRELLRVKLVERWGKESKVHHLYGLYLASAFLDHRHRDNPLIDAFRDRGLAEIPKMAIEMMEANDGGATEGTSGGGGVRFASSHVQSSLTVAQLDFLQGREEMRGGCAAAAAASEQARREQARARHSKEEITTAVLRETERYNMEPIDFSIMSMSPFDYWRSYSGSFPILSRLAARILSIPASSASCERVFSQAGLTLSKLRSGLGRETVADPMMIKYHHADGKLYYTLKDWEEMKEANDDDEADLVDLIN